MTVVIGPAELDALEIAALIGAHLGFAHRVTPPGHVFALDAGGLRDPAVTLFAARLGTDLVGLGALKQLDAGHGEIKSMHTAARARRLGVGRAMVEHLLGEARARGYRRVSLETGTGADFLPAHRLYAGFGFEPCEPFADYAASEYSVGMTLALG